MKNQPPSGGCVLKLSFKNNYRAWKWPAAFGRLCVETETVKKTAEQGSQPPSGGCVLKRLRHIGRAQRWPSRLRAAVC